MRKLVVEEDRVLRLIQVILDPAAPAERVTAYADYNSTDVPDFDAWLTALRTMLPGLYPAHVQLAGSQEELQGHLPTSDVAIVESLRIGEAELAMAPKLALVQNFGMLAENVDVAACRSKAIPVMTLRRRTNIAMGEHTVMLILALAKRLMLINGLVTVDRLAAAGLPYRPYDSQHTAKANFGRIPNLRTLHGANLGLLGLGEIGREVAMRARAFGMKVLYHKRHRLESAEEERLGVAYSPFDDLFASADYISVHVPLSGETKDLVDRAALGRMKPGAYLVNTSRAEIVNHDALLDALESGHLGGAGLDVLYQEPARGDEPLLRLENVVLTPHLGGASRLNGLNDAQEMLLGIHHCLRSGG
jgi:phosphoglycerate dehydrogenase-like enzyme